MLSSWAEEDPDELPMPAAELLAQSKSVIGRSNAQGRWLVDAFLREAAASALVRDLARPLVPGADVVTGLVPRPQKYLGGESRPAPRVAVGDDLGSLG